MIADTPPRSPSPKARTAAAKAWYSAISIAPTVHGKIEELALAIDRFAAERLEQRWRPIESAPDTTDGYSSIRVLGVLANGGYVFAHYTPAYIGKVDENKMLWMCEMFGWATKPTHWMPLPAPPSGDAARPAEPPVE
jgi:hypothetical protein